MTQNTSNKGTSHVKAIANLALESAEGINVKTTYAEAIRLRQLFYEMRISDRKSNAKIYTDPAHPMHRQSVYDSLQCRIDIEENEKATLILKTVTAALADLVIEDIATKQVINSDDLN